MQRRHAVFFFFKISVDIRTFITLRKPARTPACKTLKKYLNQTPMTKYLFIIAICSTICSCGQSVSNDLMGGLTIDPKIKTEVEKNITQSEYGAGQDEILIYNTPMLIEFYEDDKLINSYKEQDKKINVFKSFYYWQGDTLNIDGAYGQFGGTGFSIKKIKDRVILYHLLASDEFPSYAYKEKDSLVFRLEVPCTDSKIVLSEIPDTGHKQIIYGYVEFKSDDYYASSGSAEGKENLPRKKQRTNMRIYFKSAYVNFEPQE